jgi:hypothetical protein
MILTIAPRELSYTRVFLNLNRVDVFSPHLSHLMRESRLSWLAVRLPRRGCEPAACNRSLQLDFLGNGSDGVTYLADYHFQTFALAVARHAILIRHALIRGSPYLARVVFSQGHAGILAAPRALLSSRSLA